MAKIKNMEEFAALSGVSRPTISKYFHDPASVRDTTRERKIDDVMLLSLVSLIYVSIRVLVAQFKSNFWATRFVEITQYALGVFLSLLAVDLLPHGFYAYKPVIFAAFIGGFLNDQIRQSNDKGWISLNLNFTAFMLIFCYLWFALFNGHIEWQLSSLFASLLILATSWLVRNKVANRKIAHLSAVIGIIASLLMLGAQLVELVNLSNWMLIGLGGVLLIVGASLYERYGLALINSKPASAQ